MMKSATLTLIDVLSNGNTHNFTHWDNSRQFREIITQYILDGADYPQRRLLSLVLNDVDWELLERFEKSRIACIEATQSGYEDYELEIPF